VTPPWVASFDSATAMVQALAAALHGQQYQRVGQPRWMAPFAFAANLLPRSIRQEVFRWSGWAEAVRPSRLDDVSWEAFGRWVTGAYPKRGYPAMLVGSSNGAAVHLASALGAPWLPQTFLVPVRHHGHPDDPEAALRFGAEHAPRLLDRERDLQLHHMHDPNQDRLMIRHMTYFRVKGRRLSQAYRSFVADHLAPGAPLILVECTATWPTVAVGDRHRFQFGAVGGLSPDEYLQGSDRITRFLRQEGSDRDRWHAPAPDGESPEAEWGFEDRLGEDVHEYAEARGHPIMRLVLDDPVDLSPVVADVHRHWLQQRGRTVERLVAESFILMAPWWAPRTATVPFWLPFPVEPAAGALEQYLDDPRQDWVRQVIMMLFAHGIASVGHVDAPAWRRLLTERDLVFAGVDTDAHPADFATYARYHRALRSSIAPPGEPPAPLGIDELRTALAASAGAVRVTEQSA
jgi:hypothetical protein